MKKFSILILLLMCCSLALFAEPTAYEIMKMSRELPAPTAVSENAKLTIHSKKGKDRVRNVIMMSKDYGDVEKSVIVFTTPKDVAGVGYLMFNYKEGADGSNKASDNWLYMPAMKKTRRIVSSGSGGDSESSFMGTDFTYGDMDDRGLSRDDFTLIGSEIVDGVDCYKIKCESHDRKERDPDRISYISKSDYTFRKCEYYDRQGELHRILTCYGIKEIDGYLITTGMKMENVQSGTYSSYDLSNIKVNSSEVEDGLFNVAALERRAIR
ncbi:MAG: outer membrane lipoprotein-sorting protein [Sphaerochaetaceae bacterium]|nr:outer membrane lipoprotein-sorting protein [Sphaerochaetaceae bacterium]